MEKPDNFTIFSGKDKDLDVHIARISIYNAIVRNANRFKGDLLDFGCGKIPYRALIWEVSPIHSYSGLDIATALEDDEYVKPDIVWDGQRIPKEDNFYDTVIATEVLEHIFDPGDSIFEIYRKK